MEQPTNISTGIIEQIDREIARMMQQVERLQNARSVLVPPQEQSKPRPVTRRPKPTTRKQRVPLADREAAILHTLDTAPAEMTTNAVADAVGVSRGYAGTILRGMGQRGQVTELRSGAGRAAPSSWTARKTGIVS